MSEGRRRGAGWSIRDVFEDETPIKNTKTNLFGLPEPDSGAIDGRLHYANHCAA